MIWPNDQIICKIKQSTRLQIWSIIFDRPTFWKMDEKSEIDEV